MKIKLFMYIISSIFIVSAIVLSDSDPIVLGLAALWTLNGINTPLEIKK